MDRVSSFDDIRKVYSDNIYSKHSSSTSARNLESLIEACESIFCSFRRAVSMYILSRSEKVKTSLVFVLRNREPMHMYINFIQSSISSLHLYLSCLFHRRNHFFLQQEIDVIKNASRFQLSEACSYCSYWKPSLPSAVFWLLPRQRADFLMGNTPHSTFVKEFHCSKKSVHLQIFSSYGPSMFTKAANKSISSINIHSQGIFAQHSVCSRKRRSKQWLSKLASHQTSS